MKYLFVVIIIIFLMFTSCSKKVNNDIMIENNISIEDNINIVENLNIENEQDLFINENYLTLLEIREYILNDLNIKKRIFNSIDEILSSLNIPENYFLNEYIEEIPPHDAIYNVYSFEWPYYKFIFNKYESSDNYILEYLTIELNQNNYLHLFPYINKEKYIEDINFGKVYTEYLSYNSIIYGTGWNWSKWEEEDEFPSMLCSLEFNNDGILYSITFGRFYS